MIHSKNDFTFYNLTKRLQMYYFLFEVAKMTRYVQWRFYRRKIHTMKYIVLVRLATVREY